MCGVHAFALEPGADYEDNSRDVVGDRALKIYEAFLVVRVLQLFELRQFVQGGHEESALDERFCVVLRAELHEVERFLVDRRHEGR